MSLEEARSRVDFHIALPADLPDGLVAKTAVVRQDPFCLRRRPQIEIVFAGPDYGFSIMESAGDAEIGDATERIQINGTEGKVSKSHPQPNLALMSVAWKHGGVSFIATAFLSEALTEEAFLRILESIPE